MKHDLIFVRANDEDWCFRCMTRYWAEPEIKPGMLVAKSNVPQQQVHSTVWQEELHKYVTTAYQAKVPRKNTF